MSNNMRKERQVGLERLERSSITFVSEEPDFEGFFSGLEKNDERWTHFLSSKDKLG